MSNRLYLAGVKVLRGTNQDLPPGLSGAVACCFATGADHEDALRAGVSALVQMGFEVSEVVGDVTELRTDRWDEYVAQVWPEAAHALPTQAELGEILESGGVFFGPFAGFEA